MCLAFLVLTQHKTFSQVELFRKNTFQSTELYQAALKEMIGFDSLRKKTKQNKNMMGAYNEE